MFLSLFSPLIVFALVIDEAEARKDSITGILTVTFLIRYL
jgi:hypothetical protein